MNAMRLYLRYADVSVRAQMAYPISFLMQALAHVLITGMEFVALAALFQRFDSVAGWRLPEIGLLYGIVSVAFAASEAVARGFDAFGPMIRSGEFDRVLLRPRSTALQVLGQEIQLRNVGRLSQGLFVLAWSARSLDVDWTPARMVLLVASILGGACLFSGLFILQATLCFWTVETLEVVNCTTYGGVEAAKMPLSIYGPWFRRFFTFVVPLAAINYLPTLAILGRADPMGTPEWLHWMSPLAGMLFLLAAVQVWGVGVRRYCSTGS